MTDPQHRMVGNMIETHFSLTRSSGWFRLGLIGAMASIFATPMLWSLGVFDSTAAPLINTMVFGLSAIFLFGVVPTMVGWALQGFMVKRKSSDDGELQGSARLSGQRPVSPLASGHK